jgi:predicted kinase
VVEKVPEPTNPLPPLYLIVGAPASGKSTAAAALAKLYDAGVHIAVDDLRYMVVSGAAEPEMDWPLRLIEQVRIARHNAMDIAARYRAAGFAVVIDDFIDPPLLAEYEPLAADPHAVRICLTPSADVARARNRTRGGTDEWIDYLDVGIGVISALIVEHGQALTDAGWELLDNGDLTVEQTVAAIRSHTAG